MSDSIADVLARVTPKVDGLPRSVSPEETLRRIAPHLLGFGITRVANVTGLDRVGIPVFMVVRPNSRSLAVSQGKGTTEAAARASGIMESVEAHHAEYTSCAIRLETYQALSRQADVADPSGLPLARGGTFTERTLVPWTLGYDLFRRREVYVPYELVHANTLVPLMPGSGAFVRSTNGLASGNILAEAVLHALLEIVERDAIALWEAGHQESQTRVRLESIREPALCGLIERYQRAGIVPMIWNLTHDLGLPAFYVTIFDTSSDPILNPVPTAFGSGCHPDREVALGRALTEAAQSRLAIIAGSRDDLSTSRYRAFQREEAFELNRREAEEPGSVDFETIASSRTPSVEGDVSLVLERLRGAGIESVNVVDLSRPNLPVRVVRVIVPDLEGPSEHPQYAPGKRALMVGLVRPAGSSGARSAKRLVQRELGARA